MKYFKTSEVAEILDRSPQIVNYWAKRLKVSKRSKGGRSYYRYTKKDVEIIKMILTDEIFDSTRI